MDAVLSPLESLFSVTNSNGWTLGRGSARVGSVGSLGYSADRRVAILLIVELFWLVGP